MIERVSIALILLPLALWSHWQIKLGKHKDATVPQQVEISQEIMPLLGPMQRKIQAVCEIQNPGRWQKQYIVTPASTLQVYCLLDPDPLPEEKCYQAFSLIEQTLVDDLLPLSLYSCHVKQDSTKPRVYQWTISLLHEKKK